MTKLPVSALACAAEHLPKIIEELRALRIEATATVDKGTYGDSAIIGVRMPDIEESLNISVTASRPRSYGSQSKPIDGYSMRVPDGGYRDTKFVWRKDGTFRYNDIAAALANRRRSQLASRDRASRIMQRSTEHGDAILKINAMGIGFSASVNDEARGGAVKVTIGIRLNLDGPQALAFAEAMAAVIKAHTPA